MLLYETFMRGEERYGKPTNPDFLLEPGKLRGAFPFTSRASSCVQVPAR